MEFLDISKKPDLTDISAIIEKFRNGELKDGSPITVRGTLHRIKEMSGFAFVNVRSPRLVFQCVWDAERSECDIKDFSVEECVEIEGTIVAEERSKLGFDVHIKSMKRLSGRADVLPVEVGNDRKIEKLNLNTLLDHRVITLRNPRVRAIMKVCDGVMYAFRTFLRGEGFTEFVPPKLVKAGAEGGADMFEVEYFGRKAYLDQSPQTYKQMMVGVFGRVFTVGPVFRAEKFSTNRHINEFQGLDLEMGFIDSFEDIMALEARMFEFMYQTLNEQYAPELEMYLGPGKRLPELGVFPKIKFMEAKRLFADAHPGAKGQAALLEPDFSPEEEKWLGEYFIKEYNSPIVFVTHYPAVKRPFYAMEDPQDPAFTLSFDMLLGGLEVTTGGQRIHDYEEQVAKMKRRRMNIEDFSDYLTMHKYGMPPHGGLGCSLERIVASILGLDTIKRAAAFPRDRDRLNP
ncbi:MAG TPA: aspartate--tRNA(Asn) ligase [Clostridiales bacterium]|jgi:nondiscriminating aspartyl-tRNA synthetase|nr:aspartate--tRNA(Asn) ligase [Clostridiales bacterium]